eukprot:SAG31_NODE_271_length_18717_cov_8.685949_9_plen_59_part_00
MGAQHLILVSELTACKNCFDEKLSLKCTAHVYLFDLVGTLIGKQTDILQLDVLNIDYA